MVQKMPPKASKGIMLAINMPGTIGQAKDESEGWHHLSQCHLLHLNLPVSVKKPLPFLHSLSCFYSFLFFFRLSSAQMLSQALQGADVHMLIHTVCAIGSPHTQPLGIFVHKGCLVINALCGSLTSPHREANWAVSAWMRTSHSSQFTARSKQLCALETQTCSHFTSGIQCYLSGILAFEIYCIMCFTHKKSRRADSIKAWWKVKSVVSVKWIQHLRREESMCINRPVK